MIYSFPERWKVYPYNNNYEISTFGRVRRAKRLGNFGCGGILKPYKLKLGYIAIRFCGDKKRESHLIHKLVLETFVSDRPRGMECNHKDGIKSNNKLTNLEWMTSSENKKHAHRLGLYNQVGERNNYSKLTEDNVIEIRELRNIGWLLKDIAKKFNLTIRYVSDVARGKTWKHIKNGGTT